MESLNLEKDKKQNKLFCCQSYFLFVHEWISKVNICNTVNHDISESFEGTIASCSLDGGDTEDVFCACVLSKRSIVVLLASRVSGVVGEHRVEEGVLRTCKRKDIGDFEYPLLIPGLSIIPSCCTGRKDSSNNPALPLQLATVQER